MPFIVFSASTLNGLKLYLSVPEISIPRPTEGFSAWRLAHVLPSRHAYLILLTSMPILPLFRVGGGQAARYKAEAYRNSLTGRHAFRHYCHAYPLATTSRHAYPLATTSRHAYPLAHYKQTCLPGIPGANYLAGMVGGQARHTHHLLSKSSPFTHLPGYVGIWGGTTIRNGCWGFLYNTTTFLNKGAVPLSYLR